MTENDNVSSGMGQLSPEDLYVRAKTRWGTDPNAVRAKMKSVFQTMGGGSNDSPKGTPRNSDNSKKSTGPRRWENMVEVELEDGSTLGVLTELVEVLVQYSVALLLHMREGLEMNAEVSRAERAKGLQGTLKQTTPGQSVTTGDDEADYVAAQRNRLQRCGVLYARVLFTNNEWDSNHSEDQRCFEKLYTFISKAVQACVKVALEDHELWPKTGLHARLRPTGIVDEELGRLFRSDGFNHASRSKVRKRERVAFEQRGEGSDEANRFSLRPEEGAKDQQAENGEENQKKLSAIDTIVARYAARKGRRVRPEGADRTRGAIRDAAGSRSPMISSLLPSPRQKMLQVDFLRTSLVGLTPRRRMGNESLTSTLLSSTLPPVNASKSKPDSPGNAVPAPKLTNKWALSRARVPQTHRLGSSHTDVVQGFGRQTM